tara:strand:- start:51 stop:671 length:621 start_codon:yes stop_codon:yes gene_type:complete
MINEFIFFNSAECVEIKQYAYKKEKELEGSKREEKYHRVDHLHLPYNNSITTNNYNQYNFFKDHPIYAERLVDLLKKTNAPVEWPIMVQSWVNIYRKGDGIGWHKHKGDCLSLNIFIDGNTTPGPAYFLAGKDSGLNEYDCREENFMNKKGYMQIFPSSTYHKVDPVSSERITVGATLHNYKDISADALNYLSLNNKSEHGIIILS